MKIKLFIICSLLVSLSAFSQDAMMRKMSFTEFSAKAYLIPKKANVFRVLKGTRVKFVLSMANMGEEEYPLRENNYLECYYMLKSREIKFPIKLEKISQLEVIEAKITTIRNRIEHVNKMDKEKGDAYAKLLHVAPEIQTKLQLLEFLRKESSKFFKQKESAKAFDTKLLVKPGVTLTFAGSGFLPLDEDPKALGTGNLTIKIFNSDGKPISVPVKAIFY
jgi:hypothetical protein